jgi:DNA repair exonuclease SbcCD ATPase subunit
MKLKSAMTESGAALEVHAKTLAEKDQAISTLTLELQISGQKISQLEADAKDCRKALEDVEKERSILGEQISKSQKNSAELKEQLNLKMDEVHKLAARNEELRKAIEKIKGDSRVTECRVKKEKEDLEYQMATAISSAKLKLSELQLLVAKCCEKLTGLVHSQPSALDLLSLINQVQEDYEKSRTEAELLKRIQNLLRADSNSQILSAINQILDKQSALEDKLEIGNELQNLKEAVAEMRAKSDSLRQWEQWAQEVNERYGHCDPLCGDERRELVDDEIDAQNKRIQSLLIQKVFFLKNEKELLVMKGEFDGGIRPVIAITISVIRMMKRAGFMANSVMIPRKKAASGRRKVHRPLLPVTL